MKLSLHELEKLTKLNQVCLVAQKRLAKGLKLNVPEAVALIASQTIELAREGTYTVAQLMSMGKQMLGTANVLPGVDFIVDEVQVEATFNDGTKLVTIHNPICDQFGTLSLALHGSFLPVPRDECFEADTCPLHCKRPGEVISPPGYIVINRDQNTLKLQVTNKSDRPIQVGSHFHFIETNPNLSFDRIKAYGMRLNILSGTAVRFEPGERKTVSLVDIGGTRVISGGNNVASGRVVSDTDADFFDGLKKVLRDRKFNDEITDTQHSKKRKMDDGEYGDYVKVSRDVYAKMYGPTTGDIVRLADTELFIMIEKDFTVYGDECKFGGGKVLREGMGQATGVPLEQQLDTVITNAIILDYSGIYKADIGIKNGYIKNIGKAGNPQTMNGMDGEFADMIVGVNTDVIAGEGCIVTAGGMDAHIHYICPDICHQAISTGLTTLLGGGTGPSAGTSATTCTPGPYHMQMMMEATDFMPLNMAFTGKGNSSSETGLIEIIKAGAVGLKLHEDWGTTPSAIDTCLGVAEKYDVQVTIHTDTLNESSNVEHSIAAFKGRTIHTYHTEGAGGGHAPDIIKVCSLPNVIPSSTNPTRPLTVNTVDEHLDMLMVCHHLSKNIPEDISFAESRIRQETIAAEDILHDTGAISIMSSDSQAMGRVGEVVLRTWQTADKMKRIRGQLAEDRELQSAAQLTTDLSPVAQGAGAAGGEVQIDNLRAKRYVAKYTINPAIAHGMSHIIGSVEKGKFADLVIWKPSYFGVKPEMILKGGHIAWAQMGDANASIPTPQPVYMRPMFAAQGAAAARCSILFVSKAYYDDYNRMASSAVLSDGAKGAATLRKQVVPVLNTRGIGKKDMKLNDAMPFIGVDPESFSVTADGEPLSCEPSTFVPMARLYFA